METYCSNASEDFADNRVNYFELKKANGCFFQEIDDLIIEGNKSRTVAATNMNSESSR